MQVDALGDHYSACMPSGRVKARAGPIEGLLAQICREAGGRVRTNALVRDLNVATTSADERRLEVVVSGLPVFGGAQLALDVTARSVLTRNGQPRSTADWKDAAVADAARASKELKYPEFARGNRCRLVVLAVEVGGRFSGETVEFFRQLAAAKSSSAPSYLRTSAAAAYERRWSRMLAVGVASAHAASLLLSKDELVQLGSGAGVEPWLQDVLTEARGGFVEPSPA